MPWALVSASVSIEDVRRVIERDPQALQCGFNRQGMTCAHLLALRRNPDMAVVRMVSGFYGAAWASEDEVGLLPIDYAAQHCESVKLVQYLLQQNPSAMRRAVSCGFRTPLLPAVKNKTAGGMAVFNCVLDVDRCAVSLIIPLWGWTELFDAVRTMCHPEIVATLVRGYLEALSQRCGQYNLLPLHEACSTAVSTGMKQSHVISIIFSHFMKHAVQQSLLA